jgi:16S rRNA (guanine527-N7)-methyltransferase
MTLEARIQEGAARMALALPESAVAKCAAYLRLLEKWNRVHNLTAVRETERMVVLHLLDSFSVLPHIEGARSILDVGTGGGLPGIPIAIARPELRVTLLDSSSKKTTFLEQARTELALSHVEVVCARVEQWRPDHLFDVVVSRAFADLGEFVSQAEHLVAPSGRMLAMKGVYPFEEIARLPATHRVAQVAELHVPELDAKRHLVFVERAQAADGPHLRHREPERRRRQDVVAVNLSASLAHYGRRVLLVDLDPQGNATTGSGIDKSACEKTVYGVLLGEYGLREATVTAEGAYDVVPSNRELAGAEVELIGMEKREYRLREAFAGGRSSRTTSSSSIAPGPQHAHGERLHRGRRCDHPDAVRVLRARGACPISWARFAR